jgi:tRNA (guanine-N7-)-methyltransferase
LASFISNLEVEKYKKIKLFKSDIRELFLHLSKQIFDEIFILYPDPWPKARHEKRRILNRENLSLLLSNLKINGKIFIATDVKKYFDSIYKLFESNVNVKIINFNNFYLRPKKIIITRYEKKALSNKVRPLYLEVKKILD